MPPRRQRDIVEDPFRGDLLREFQVTEGQIRELRALDLDEALFRIGHECTALSVWAKRKADFLTNEVRQGQRSGPEPPRRVGGVVQFVDPHNVENVTAHRIG